MSDLDGCVRRDEVPLVVLKMSQNGFWSEPLPLSLPAVHACAYNYQMLAVYFFVHVVPGPAE